MRVRAEYFPFACNSLLGVFELGRKNGMRSRTCQVEVMKARTYERSRDSEQKMKGETRRETEGGMKGRVNGRWREEKRSEEK